MDLDDLEGLALALYAELGVDPEQPVTTFRLARAWLGTTVERRHLVATPAAMQRFGGKTTIVVRPSATLEYAHFFVGHELGHLLLEREGYAGEDVEACADYLGAALMLPRAAVVATYKAEGFAPRALAETVVCTQTAAALRLGEVVRLPLAAVSPQLVRVRGPEVFVWPDEGTVRTWASRPRPGIAKVRLTDQKGRVALVADDDVSEVG
jgi:hypothetical protein